MKIKWNEVTWYSQIIALVLFLLVFVLGMYVGMQVEKHRSPSFMLSGAHGQMMGGFGGMHHP